MARRKKSGLKALIEAPWWVSLLLGSIWYVLFAYVLPAVGKAQMGELPLASALTSGLSNLKYFAVVILCISPISALHSLFNNWNKRRRLAGQQNIEDIRQLSWREFEELVAEAYRQQGYEAIENTGGGADGGVDIRLKKDGALHLVQCKHWKSWKVGVKVVRELAGVMHKENATSASVVCTGIYTQEAKKLGCRPKHRPH